MLRLSGLSIFILCFALAVNAEAKDIWWMDVRELTPTQDRLGLREVKMRAEKFEKMSKKERHHYLITEEPIPVIIGPPKRGYGNEPEWYMFDHHHMARGLLKSGHQMAGVDEVADWSGPFLRAQSKAEKDQARAEFWKKMEKHGYVLLRDKDWNPITPEQLPNKLEDMKNDNFRSFAYAVRKREGYAKTKVPFAEFFWAHYFRQFFTEKDLEKNWDAAVDRALELAKLPEAADLPGFKGSKSLICKKAFK